MSSGKNSVKRQVALLRAQVFSAVNEANSSVSPERQVTYKSALTVVKRSLDASRNKPFEVREFHAMRELSAFITLSQKNKSLSQAPRNTDLLPVGHPASTTSHAMTASALVNAQIQWALADNRISDEARPLLASLYTSEPESPEYKYALIRLGALPPGSAPLEALTASFGDGNSFAARRARAMLQRRDRMGRFAYQGGGIKALIKRLSGVVENLTGKTVSSSSDGNTVRVELPDGRLTDVPVDSGEFIKAIINPTPDGFSGIPAQYSAGDTIADEASLQFFDAPHGFTKDDSYSGDGVMYTDDSYDIIKRSDGTFDVSQRGAKGLGTADSWSESMKLVQDDEPNLIKAEGNKAEQIARLTPQQIDDMYDPEKNPFDVNPGGEGSKNKESAQKQLDNLAEAGIGFDLQEDGSLTYDLGEVSPNVTAERSVEVVDGKFKVSETEYTYDESSNSYDVTKESDLGTYDTVDEVLDDWGTSEDVGQQYDDWKAQQAPEAAPEPVAELPATPEPSKKVEEFTKFEVPQGAIKLPLDPAGYDPEGRIDEESTDFTDDPAVLANKYDTDDLVDTLEAAIVPQDGAKNATGYGPLEFNQGEEFVPAEAIYSALDQQGEDAQMIAAKIYDDQNGDTKNQDALKAMREVKAPAEKIAEISTPAQAGDPNKPKSPPGSTHWGGGSLDIQLDNPTETSGTVSQLREGDYVWHDGEWKKVVKREVKTRKKKSDKNGQEYTETDYAIYLEDGSSLEQYGHQHGGIKRFTYVPVNDKTKPVDNRDGTFTWRGVTFRKNFGKYSAVGYHAGLGIGTSDTPEGLAKNIDAYLDKSGSKGGKTPGGRAPVMPDGSGRPLPDGGGTPDITPDGTPEAQLPQEEVVEEEVFGSIGEILKAFIDDVINIWNGNFKARPSLSRIRNFSEQTGIPEADIIKAIEDAGIEVAPDPESEVSVDTTPEPDVAQEVLYEDAPPIEAVTPEPTNEPDVADVIDSPSSGVPTEEEIQSMLDGEGIGEGDVPAVTRPTGQLEDINYETSKFIPNDPDNPAGAGTIEKSTGTAKIIDIAGRKVVIIDINGTKVPFYLSTGAGGKVDVPAGKWYPIFGIGEDGWFNKGTSAQINDYYGSPELRAQAEWLDANIGDIRADDSIPKATPTGPHIDAINTDLTPTSNFKEDSQTNLDANIASTLEKISSADIETPAEVTSKKAAEATPEAPSLPDGGDVEKTFLDSLGNEYKPSELYYLDPNGDLESQIQEAIDAGKKVGFSYSSQERVVDPVDIVYFPNTGNTNLVATDSEGKEKQYTLSKMGSSTTPSVANPSEDLPPLKEAVLTETAEPVSLPEPIGQPQKVTTSVKDLQPGDVLTNDFFTVESVYSDAESEEAKPGSVWVTGYYPGHASQKTKLWYPGDSREVFRFVEPPAKGDLPELSKPFGKDFGKVYKDKQTGEWKLTTPEAQAAYDAAKAEYDQKLADAMGKWTAPEGAPSLDATTPSPTAKYKTVVNASDLKPGDITFKSQDPTYAGGLLKEPYQHYFVVEEVFTDENTPEGKVNVRGYYPGHESQVREWNSDTALKVIRGDDLPVAGDKPALIDPKQKNEKYEKDSKGNLTKAGREEWLKDKAAFIEASKASAQNYNDVVDTYVAPEQSAAPEKSAPEKPKKPYKTAPAFQGERLIEIVKAANGDPAKLKELLDKEEVTYMDFETDANSWNMENIQPIQVAAHKIINGEIVDSFMMFMNPGMKLGAFYYQTELTPDGKPKKKDGEVIFILDENGNKILKGDLKTPEGNPVDDAWLATQPGVDEVMPQFFEWLGQNAIIAGHNIGTFDEPLLKQQAANLGVDYKVDGILDTLPLARSLDLKTENNKLGTLTNYFGVKLDNWHDAAADSMAVKGIFDGLLDEMSKTSTVSSEFDPEAVAENIAENNSAYEAAYKAWEDYQAGIVQSAVINGGVNKDGSPITTEQLVKEANAGVVLNPENFKGIPPEINTEAPSLDSSSWVNDDENTTLIEETLRPTDFKVGDFIPAANDGFYQILDIADDLDNKDFFSITTRYVGTDSIQVKKWFKYNKNFNGVRRPNDSVDGSEIPEIDQPTVEAPQEGPPTEWNGYSVKQNSSGAYYAENISTADAIALRTGELDPPALPFFVPDLHKSGSSPDGGEGDFYTAESIASGVRKYWGQYGGTGIIIRRKNADGNYEYLLGRRSGTSSGAGKWSTFGGANDTLEAKANPETTAFKELQEEAGLDLSTAAQISLVHDSTSDPDWSYKTLVADVSSGAINEGDIKLNWENSEFGWFTADQINDLNNQGVLHAPFASSVDGILNLSNDNSSGPNLDAPASALTPTSPAEDGIVYDISEWTQIGQPGEAGGSTGGSVYVDNKGNTFFVKPPNNVASTEDPERHARNEALASAFYEEAGVQTGRAFLGRDKDGNFVIVSPWIDGSTKDFKDRMSDPEVLKKAQEAFAVDAWLMNWDSVGLSYDNMIMVGDDVYRIDPGGSLLYRARGISKQEQMADKVTELDSLRSGTNKEAAAVFGSMTDEQLAESAKLVKAISPERISQIVDAGFPDDKTTADFLKQKLIARRQDLIDRFGLDKKKEKPAEAAPEKKPEPTASNIVYLNPDNQGAYLVDQINNAIASGQQVEFFYSGSESKNRLVTPKYIYTNPKNGNINLIGFDQEAGEEKTYTLQKVQKSTDYPETVDAVDEVKEFDAAAKAIEDEYPEYEVFIQDDFFRVTLDNDAFVTVMDESDGTFDVVAFESWDDDGNNPIDIGQYKNLEDATNALRKTIEKLESGEDLIPQTVKDVETPQQAESIPQPPEAPKLNDPEYDWKKTFGPDDFVPGDGWEALDEEDGGDEDGYASGPEGSVAWEPYLGWRGRHFDLETGEETYFQELDTRKEAVEAVKNYAASLKKESATPEAAPEDTPIADIVSDIIDGGATDVPSVEEIVQDVALDASPKAITDPGLIFESLKETYPDHVELPNGDLLVRRKSVTKDGVTDLYDTVVRRNPDETFSVYIRETNGLTGATRVVNYKQAVHSDLAIKNQINRRNSFLDIKPDLKKWMTSKKAVTEDVPEAPTAQTNKDIADNLANPEFPQTGDMVTDSLLQLIANAASEEGGVQKILDMIQNMPGISEETYQNLLSIVNSQLMKAAPKTEEAKPDKKPHVSADGVTPVKPGDTVRYVNRDKDGNITEQWVGTVKKLVEAQQTDAAGYGKYAYSDYVWVTVPGKKKAIKRVSSKLEIVSSYPEADTTPEAPSAPAAPEVPEVPVAPEVPEAPATGKIYLDPNGDIEAQVQDAIDNGKEISFLYKGEERTVTPSAIFTHSGTGNLLISGKQDGKPKNFKVDNVEKSADFQEYTPSAPVNKPTPEPKLDPELIDTFAIDGGETEIQPDSVDGIFAYVDGIKVPANMLGQASLAFYGDKVAKPLGTAKPGESFYGVDETGEIERLYVIISTEDLPSGEVKAEVVFLDSTYGFSAETGPFSKETLYKKNLIFGENDFPTYVFVPKSDGGDGGNGGGGSPEPVEPTPGPSTVQEVADAVDMVSQGIKNDPNMSGVDTESMDKAVEEATKFDEQQSNPQGSDFSIPPAEQINLDWYNSVKDDYQVQPGINYIKDVKVGDVVSTWKGDMLVINISDTDGPYEAKKLVGIFIGEIKDFGGAPIDSISVGGENTTVIRSHKSLLKADPYAGIPTVTFAESKDKKNFTNLKGLSSGNLKPGDIITAKTGKYGYLYQIVSIDIPKGRGFYPTAVARRIDAFPGSSQDGILKEIHLPTYGFNGNGYNNVKRPNDAWLSKASKDAGLVKEKPKKSTPTKKLTPGEVTTFDSIDEFTSDASDKNSDDFYKNFETDNYSSYKAAASGLLVKDGSDGNAKKNLVPGIVVTDKAGKGNAGVITNTIDIDKSQIRVTWLSGPDAGSSQDLWATDVLSEEKFLTPEQASNLGVQIDTTIEDKIKANVREKAKQEAAAKAAAEKKAKEKAEKDKLIKDNSVGGSGAESVVIQDKISWSDSDFEGVPSLTDAISKTNEDVTLGSFGIETLVDSDSIEDSKIKVYRVKDKNGKWKTRIRFKLTDWAGKERVQELIDSGAKSTSRLEFIKLSQQDDGSIKVGSAWPKSKIDQNGAGTTWSTPVLDDQGKEIGNVLIHRAVKDASTPDYTLGKSSGKALSYNNEVDLYLPDNATPEQIELALKTAGVEQARPATKADIKVLAENKIIALFADKVDGSKNFTGELRKKILDDVKKDYNLDAADVVPEVINGRYITLIIPQDAADKIAKETGTGYFNHNWHHTNDMGTPGKKRAEFIFNLLTNDGLQSTVERRANGVNTGGMSSTADGYAVGANYIFTSKSKSIGGSFSFDGKKLLRRLDFYANSGDAFGKKSQKDVLAELSKNSLYEVLFKGTISWADLAYINVDSKTRDILIEMLTNAGIKDFGGTPIDKVIK